MKKAALGVYLESTESLSSKTHEACWAEISGRRDTKQRTGDAHGGAAKHGKPVDEEGPAPLGGPIDM